MAYELGAIEAALAAAVGDEPTLIAELRTAFADSAKRTLAAMEDAQDADTWRAAASRLRGLAASFGALDMMDLAAEAMESSHGDSNRLAELRRSIARL